VPPAVGFAGLGAMGRGMARNLHKAGMLSALWNRTAGRAAELAVELGVYLGTGATLTLGLSAVFFVASMYFVHRSFYGMRIGASAH